jgi:hypothetical protein
MSHKKVAYDGSTQSYKGTVSRSGNPEGAKRTYDEPMRFIKGSPFGGPSNNDLPKIKGRKLR